MRAMRLRDGADGAPSTRAERLRRAAAADAADSGAAPRGHDRRRRRDAGAGARRDAAADAAVQHHRPSRDCPAGGARGPERHCRAASQLVGHRGRDANALLDGSVGGARRNVIRLSAGRHGASTSEGDLAVLSRVFHEVGAAAGRRGERSHRRPFEWGTGWIDDERSTRRRRRRRNACGLGRAKRGQQRRVLRARPCDDYNCSTAIGSRFRAPSTRRTPRTTSSARAIFPSDSERDGGARSSCCRSGTRTRGSRRTVPAAQPVRHQRAAAQPAVPRCPQCRPSFAARTTSSAPTSAGRRRCAGRRCSMRGARSRGWPRRDTSRSGSSARAWARAWRC